jgi:Zn-dependent protease
MESTAVTTAPTHEPLPAAPTGGSPSRTRPTRRSLSGLLLALGLLALRLKTFAFLALTKARELLLVNPFEGFGATQFTVAGVSMAVTIAAYATKWPLAFAVGFVTITLVHEIGHALLIRAKGLRAGVLVFIPFIGGAVTLKDQPRSAYDDAQIALAGPFAGTFAALASLQIYKWTGQTLYLSIALAGFVLNLLNLLPIGVLDGGRISAAITKWMWLFGGGVLVYKAVKQQSPLYLLVLLLAAFQVYNSIRHEKDDTFYEISTMQRVAVAVAYFGLVVFLGHQAYMANQRLISLG